jgi:hypothetical protein
MILFMPQFTIKEQYQENKSVLQQYYPQNNIGWIKSYINFNIV